MKKNRNSSFVQLISCFDGLESHLKMYIWAIMFIEKIGRWESFKKYSESMMKEIVDK